MIEDSLAGVTAGLAAGAAVLGVPSCSRWPQAPGWRCWTSLAGRPAPPGRSSTDRGVAADVRWSADREPEARQPSRCRRPRSGQRRVSRARRSAGSASRRPPRPRPGTAGECRRRPGRAPGGRTSRRAGVLLGRKSPVATARSIAAQMAMQGALEADQLVLVGGVGERVAVLEVEQLQLGGDHAAGAPEHQRVELHLEQRLALERLARHRAGLVVDDPQRAVRGDVQPVDEAAQQQPVGQRDLDQFLAAVRLDAGRVLQREVLLDQLPGREQPRLDRLRRRGRRSPRRRPGRRRTARRRRAPRAARPRPARAAPGRPRRCAAAAGRS